MFPFSLFALLARLLQASSVVAGWHLLLNAAPVWARLALPQLVDSIQDVARLVGDFVLRNGP